MITMKALRDAGKVVGTVGRYTLVGVLIVRHFVMTIIGFLICVITRSQVWIKKKQRREERRAETTKSVTKKNSSRQVETSVR